MITLHHDSERQIMNPVWKVILMFQETEAGILKCELDKQMYKMRFEDESEDKVTIVLEEIKRDRP